MRYFGSIAAKAAGVAASVLASGCMTIAGTPEKAPDIENSPEKPHFVQADVLGLSAGGLDDLFGPAALTRREGSGEFRRYAFARCELIVILYPDEAGAVSVRQLDAAAKKAGDAKPDLDDCLAGGLAPALG